ncbi:NADH-quinone oxidoreductase subunit M [Botrimarina colliarenosi]|uniref:NADH-quinone oxidoreductase subunit M n=1 Tax=Botrimarina colliarenosi TaxID=2528001 RepID=A0A5C6AKK1_9BACT|nr:NADH-quinone oxidoreductase subunit M [Botrimarina colliarenosi]TWU00008.1 NADH-quinone oxidoreductase subunit M [Botrimarina colliarenosi]
MNDHALTLLVLLPAAAACAMALVPKSAGGAAKKLTLATTALVALIAWSLAFDGRAGGAGLSHIVSAPWIPSLGVQFFLGVDGVSLPLVILTASLSFLAALASLGVERHPRGYCALLLLLQTGMLGVFLALDFVVFYVFWELILVPMYLLIAVWGGDGGRRAALKYFIYTLAGSVLMLGAGLLLYGQSDLTRLAPADLAECGVMGPDAAKPHASGMVLAEWLASDDPLAERYVDAEAAGAPLRTFNLSAMARLARSTDVFTSKSWGGHNLAWWAFVLLAVGLAIKLPAVPLHTWLPDAHTEAPTPVSMLLAGVMLKLGGYGLVRIAWPVCPEAARDLAFVVAVVGVVGLFWGALAAMAQTDFKRLVAYSSVSHMGYVLIGLAAGTLGADAWALGATGAVFQMVAHGVTSAGLFFAVGVIYERVHHRDLNQLGGLMNRMPTASGLALVLALASLGLPCLCGFVGELLVLLPAWTFNPYLAAAAASVTVLIAAYTLRAVRLAYYGPEYRGPNGDRLTPVTPRELAVLIPLAVAAVVLGVRPGIVTEVAEPALVAAGQPFAHPHPNLPGMTPVADAADARRTTR